MEIKIAIICVIAIVVLYAYGNHFRRKKKRLIEASALTCNYEIVKVSNFTIEEMLKWFKSHHDTVESDEYVLSRVTEEALMGSGVNIVMPNVDIDHSLLLMVVDMSHKNIKHARVVTFIEVEKDILDMLENKNLIILE
jgi:hypothetical protein